MSASLKDVAAKDSIEVTAGFKKMRDAMGQLFGGSHPLAPQMITPEQQRNASRFGIELTNLRSNK